MSVTKEIVENTKVSVVPSAAGTKFSSVTYLSSDTKVLTVTPDATNKVYATMVGVKPGTSTVTVKATATTTDGKTHAVSNTITVTVRPAVVMTFTFGAPVPNH